MPQNIYLTGFMGCGKSHIGKMLAQKLGRPFVDLDIAFAEDHDGISAGDFIREFGEPAFRQEEHKLLLRVSKDLEFTVIATGGGLPIYPGNQEIMTSSGISIFLHVPLESIERRLSADETGKRPLWNANDTAARRKRYLDRMPFYRQANYIIEGELSPAETMAAILDQVGSWLKKAPLKTQSFKQLLRQVARDSADFNLFEPNDRLLVGISGGEDSLVLMHLLESLQQRLPFPIAIIPATIDLDYPGFDGTILDRYCQSQGWQLQRRSIPEFQELLKQQEDDGLPCPVCSRLRRGKLHGLLDEFGCNKLVLGHHLDDLCVSFMISLCRGGGLKTMGPNVAADGGKARLIRPLWGCRKEAIHAVAQLFNFPQLTSCPYEEQLEAKGDRAYFTRLLKSMEERIPDLTSAMRHSMADLRTGHLLDKRFLDSL